MSCMGGCDTLIGSPLLGRKIETNCLFLSIYLARLWTGPGVTRQVLPQEDGGEAPWFRGRSRFSDASCSSPANRFLARVEGDGGSTIRNQEFEIHGNHRSQRTIGSGRSLRASDHPVESQNERLYFLCPKRHSYH
ncbi:protein of unknown function [Nitrospina watsonii]|uniref:Uncharacterized protein n=1 Tax=Nitrospina watsonii TaxID=1323948 RepID=A0ABM9H9Z7_9BACT|nr:protein of unknown function [Nitrospina watsonii]